MSGLLVENFEPDGVRLPNPTGHFTNGSNVGAEMGGAAVRSSRAGKDVLFRAEQHVYEQS